nr:MAG TPA: hypothetical protein [Caudoviricetes sp.]
MIKGDFCSSPLLFCSFCIIFPALLVDTAQFFQLQLLL